MKRTFSAVAVSAAPFVALFAGHAAAQVSISTSTSAPIATATASSGAPANIDITSTGSIGITNTAGGTAVTVNSNNAVTNEGSIGFTDINNATGVQLLGGNTGAFTTTGTINVTESYTATADTNRDGLLTGKFANGSNRIGLLVSGAGAFTGNLPAASGFTNPVAIYETGAITVHGDSSFGVQIAAPVIGDFQMLKVTPATSTVAATVATGSITVIGGETVSATNPNGNGSIGLNITSAGSITGNVRLAGVNATGVGARAVVINGAVSGSVDFTGTVIATGYRTTTRPTNPGLAKLYTADEMQQGGSAVTIGASIGGGVLISARPLTLSTTNLDLDGNGVPDTLQGTGQIASYGTAPAMVVGAAGSPVTLGNVVSGASNVPSGAFGLVNQGTIFGDGVFDQVTSPNLPAPASATALQIGGQSGGTVSLGGGLFNVGAITAQSFQADATAIHIGAGATVPTIRNDGAITATTSQISAATTGVALNVNAILIDAGANVTNLVNNSGIIANITGTGGLGGNTGAVIDKSGTLTNITNTGTISAQLTQTLDTVPMPGTVTAIDLSQGTTAQSLTQQLSANQRASTAYNAANSYVIGNIVSENGVLYQATAAVGVAVDPATTATGVWRQIGATVPSIYGSIKLGSGGNTVLVTAGTVNAPVFDLGSGADSLTINGDAKTVVTGAIYVGTANGVPLAGNNTLKLDVTGGTLSDTYAGTIQASSVHVGSAGTLLVSADPSSGANTKFVTTGASVFDTGATLGLTLHSLQASLTHDYIILQTAGAGTLTVGTFAAGVLNNAPWLYTATPSAVAGTASCLTNCIVLTVAQKSATQLGVNAAEASALNAILKGLPNDNGVHGLESALLSQSTEAGFKSVYDQLLPSQGQGLFEALESATRSVASMTSTTPDAGTRVAGSSLWLQEVNQRVNRTGVQTLGSYAKLFGVVGGYEHMGQKGGAFGGTLSYMNAEESVAGAQVGSSVVASVVEGSLYYRRAVGGLRIAARAGGGYAFFSGRRKFVATGAADIANSSWGGFFFDGNALLAYEQRFGRFYARPELTADYFRLDESAHTETGGGNGFDLALAARNSSRLSGQAVVVLGAQWGTANWLRTEIHGGYREVLSGSIGDTIASFAGGDPFTMAPDKSTGGWATFGLSIKAGSQYSYLALEGDAEMRAGERQYNVRIAGRSMF